MSGVGLKGGSEIFRRLLTFADILTYGQNGFTKIKFTTISIGFWTLIRSLIVNELFNLILQVLPREYSKSINLSLICIYLISKENARSTPCWVSHCLQASSNNCMDTAKYLTSGKGGTLISRYLLPKAKITWLVKTLMHCFC